MDRGAWWATDHGVKKSRTRLSDFTSLGTVMAPQAVSFNLLIEDRGLVLSAILVPFDSSWFMLCPWAVSFFQKLCPAPFPPVTTTTQMGKTGAERDHPEAVVAVGSTALLTSPLCLSLEPVPFAATQRPVPDRPGWWSICEEPRVWPKVSPSGGLVCHMHWSSLTDYLFF